MSLPVAKHCLSINNNPAGIYLLKVNNRNTRTRCEICSELTIKIPERRQWRRSGIFIVNFEHISHPAGKTLEQYPPSKYVLVQSQQ